MTFRRLTLALTILLCLLGGASLADTPPSLLSRAQAAREKLMSVVRDSSNSVVVRASAALQFGLFPEVQRLLPEVREQDPAAAARLYAEYTLDTYRFKEARAAISLLENLPHSPESDLIKYRWLFITEDLSTVDSLTTACLERDSTDVAALLARGELLLKMLRYDESLIQIKKVFSLSLSPAQHARAELILSMVLVKQGQFQGALDSLSGVFMPTTLNDDILFNAGSTLIHLSRVSEAIDMFEEAIRWNDWNEVAHYYLGNGYARKNYTQIRSEHPANFADSTERLITQAVRDLLNRGESDSAHAAVEKIIENHPLWISPIVLHGYIHWTKQEFDSAETCFRSAIALMPEFGRAQNGLAKTLEGMRMRVNVHRASDAAAFEAKSMPTVPGVEEFILNWKSLSPRHQKQVALAVEPWKAYVPVLLECGNRYYIKPLYELLSESPGLETIRDQRINYDSRLWDDVRGCGGFTTVTGIEDVERSIYSNYNTVLHELTHQVHSLFPPDDLQKIQDAFQAAHKRQENGGNAFMSQYAATSVQEYFAEGANSYFSPQRDKYDTREIVRQRLFAMDTTLVRLVEYYLPGPHLTDCYPVGLVNAADDAIEKHDMKRAHDLVEKAYTRAPHNQSVLAELSHIHSLLDQDKEAIAYADTLVALFPHKAASYNQLQSAHFFADRKMNSEGIILQQGLAKVDPEERKSLHQSYGNLLYYTGKYGEAEDNYRKILAQRATDSDALWGLGLAFGDQGNFSRADSAFALALKERNGITDLRMDYARILIKAGRLDDAAKQVEEAKLLDPQDEMVMTMSGWLSAKKGQFAEALSQYDLVLKTAPWLNLASVLRTEALQKTGKSNEAKEELERLRALSRSDIPEWVWVQHRTSFIAARTWPKYLLDMLK